MNSRRQKLLGRVNWYLQSSLKHITKLITGNKSYYRGGRYRQVSLYFPKYYMKWIQEIGIESRIGHVLWQMDWQTDRHTTTDGRTDGQRDRRTERQTDGYQDKHRRPKSCLSQLKNIDTQFGHEFSMIFFRSYIHRIWWNIIIWHTFAIWLSETSHFSSI